MPDTDEKKDDTPVNDISNNPTEKKSANIAIQANNEISESSDDSNQEDNNVDEEEYIDEFFLEAVKYEYQHSISVQERLTNKIYLLLTIYAFLATILAGSFVVHLEDCILSGVYYTLLFGTIVLFGGTLKFFLGLLKFAPINHYEGDSFLYDGTVERRIDICRSLVKHTIHNKQVLNDRNRKFNQVLPLVFILVFAVILLSFMSKFVV